VIEDVPARERAAAALRRMFALAIGSASARAENYGQNMDILEGSRVALACEGSVRS
jgi:hypothetical protein